MSEDLRREIREILQEEMRPRISSSPNTSIISRTRNLIQQATQSTVSADGSLFTATTGSSRSSPSHQHRIINCNRKRKMDQIGSKTFEVQVIKYSPNPDITITEDSVLLKQVMVDLKSDYKEFKIREVISHAIEMRFPKIKPKYFEFLKRERSKLYVPVVTNEFKWDYAQIKTLIGQGKLYVRLLVDDSSLVGSSDEESDDLPEPPYFQYRQPVNDQMSQYGPYPSTSDQSTCGPSTILLSTSQSKDTMVEQTTSASSSSCDQDTTISTLEELFPNLPHPTIQEVFNNSNDLNEMIDTLTSSSQFHIIYINHKPKKRLEVDEESCMEDCLAFYKNRSFDPLVPLRIVFSGQKAIDAGGLLRQFYTSSVDKISSVLFEGKQGKLVPKCDANTCLSEIYVVVGKMISHNIAQRCAGFPLLADACYQYLCTGSLKDASVYVKVDQVASAQYEYFIKEVCHLLWNFRILFQIVFVV